MALGVNQRAAPGDLADGVHHLARRARLVNEAAGARLEGREACDVAVLSGQEDVLCVGRDAPNRRGGVGAGAVVEAEVQEHDVGQQLRSHRGRLRHRAHVADHGHVLLIVEERRQAVGHDLMVLDDEDADGLIRTHFGKGTQNSTIVPAPSSLLILHQPPASRARSFSASSPR